jgi:peptidoglycan/LPS O-acetylase OafA/YrhL
MKKKFYRPEIDGLRAFAVVAVIINHFNRSLLPSGFLGVDIFFVISGYVITGSLATHHSATIKQLLVEFYARRIKRLLPALVLCVGITGLIGCMIIAFPSNSLSTGALALLGASNLYLYQQSIDYFGPSAELNLFTQTWSLGVEEQFYLFFPTLAWASGWLRKKKVGEHILLGLLGGFGFVSLFSFVYLADSNPTAAYFLPGSRFWELSFGCGLFLIQEKNHHRVIIFKGINWVGSLCLFGMLATMLLLKQGSIAISTILVVVATAAFVFFVKSSDRSYRLMSNDQVVGIGLMSYSLYLWHWSVLVIARLSVGVNSITMPFVILLTFACAYCSYQWVEKPLRSSQWAPSQFITIILGGTIVVAMAGIFQAAAAASTNWLYTGSRSEVEKFNIIPKQFPGVGIKKLPYHATCVVDGIQWHYEAQMFDNCTSAASRQDKNTLFFMGDSHAGQLLGLADELHNQKDFGVHLIETPGEPFPVEPLFGSGLGRAYKRLVHKKILKRVLETGKRGDVVVISRLYSSRFTDTGSLQSLMSDRWLKNLGGLADQLKSHDMGLIVVAPTPMFEFSDISLCEKQWFHPLPNPGCWIGRDKILNSNHQIMIGLKRISDQHGNIWIFDPMEPLCAGGAMCSLERAGKVLYRDADHLSSLGAATLLLDFQKLLDSKVLPALGIKG